MSGQCSVNRLFGQTTQQLSENANVRHILMALSDLGQRKSSDLESSEQE
jgi:hypothetical protein